MHHFFAAEAILACERSIRRALQERKKFRIGDLSEMNVSGRGPEEDTILLKRATDRLINPIFLEKIRRVIKRKSLI